MPFVCACPRTYSPTTVRHGFVVRETPIRAVLVGEHLGLLSDAREHERLKGGPVHRFDHSRAHAARGAVFDASDGDLADRPTASVEALALVLVAFLAADERLVHLDRASELFALVIPCFAQAVREVPRGLLRDPEVAVELHAAHALEVRGEQVGRERPRLVPEVRAFHHRFRS